MRAIIVGAGPAGLATAACLKRAGHQVRLLERGQRVGEAWHRHYDRLRLHTPRSRSALPGLDLPRDVPRYPSRGDLATYLADYAAHFDLDVVLGAEVESVEAVPGGWAVHHRGGTEVAEVAVLATGLNAQPNLPDLPGLDGFNGPVAHSSRYRNPAGLPGQRVLVIGFGNSGGDIALDLAEAGRRVSVSVRGAVNILPKELLGIPIVSFELLTRILPAAWADALTAPVLRLATGRPERYGLTAARYGPAVQVIEEGRIPLIDVGALAAIRAGRIAVRPGVARFEPGRAIFVDGDQAAVDAVVLATGYRVDLRPLLGTCPEALDETGRPLVSGGRTALPGLYFCSYDVAPNGQLRQIAREAQAIAADVTARQKQAGG